MTTPTTRLPRGRYCRQPLSQVPTPYLFWWLGRALDRNDDATRLVFAEAFRRFQSVLGQWGYAHLLDPLPPAFHPDMHPHSADGTEGEGVGASTFAPLGAPPNERTTP